MEALQLFGESMRESQIQKAIKDGLVSLGYTVWRNNVLNGFFTPKKGIRAYWITTGVNGLSDLSMLLPDGKTLYIEIKTNKGKQLDTQRDFETVCIKNNVPYIIARSIQDILDFLDVYLS